MRNLDVSIILVYYNIYFLWSWTFKDSQRLTFSAFVLLIYDYDFP